jgi:hypothetical protein
MLPQWQHLALKVPLFSDAELPLKEPAPISTYSVGEEISNSAPIKIAWSPSGLGKHRRCALATLTTNLTLSIWSAECRPHEEQSWGRRLIVNNALVEYFRDCDDDPSHLTVLSKERLRLRSRIRTFSWAPAIPCPAPAGVMGTRLLYGQHLLAITNDDNQLVFVVVESPASTLGVERRWRAEVLTHDSFGPDSDSIFTAPNCFEDMMKQQRYVSHIVWSPWIIQGVYYHSVVVYATNEEVRAKCITYTHDTIGLGEEAFYTDLELRYDGLMKFCPTVENGDRVKLALFTTSGLVHLTISVRDASIIEQTAHDLDGRWDQTSGAVWDAAEERSPRLHVSSLLSTLHNPTSVLEVSANELKSHRTPNWREQIANNLALFSVKNELSGKAKAKVWGLTSSPLGDYIAACTSLHPSDMIEYGIPADRQGTVAISSLRFSSQVREAFPNVNVSAEGVAYTLKKLAESTVEDPEELPAYAEQMIEKLVQAYTPALDSKDGATTLTLYPDASDLETLIATFKKVFFLNAQTLKDRYTVLVHQACKIGSDDTLEMTSISYRLAMALQQLPTALTNTSFSTEIVAQHMQLLEYVNSIMGLEPTVGQSSTHDEVLPARAWTDTCDFCSTPIPFSDLGSAICTNGHQFPRCGLSFLAIQAPGITKYCGICSTPYFSDEFVLAQEYVDQKSGTDTEDDTVMIGVIANGEGPEGDDREQTSIRGLDNANETEESQQRPAGDGAVMTGVVENGEVSGGGVDGGEETITGVTNNVNGAEESQEDQANGTIVQQSDGNIRQEEDAEDDRRELPVTLARVLFLACDACIYCGGKFVG